MGSFAINNFARRQTPESGFSHFGGGEDQLSAMPSFTRAGSSFTRRRADTASALPSPRGGIEGMV